MDERTFQRRAVHKEYSKRYRDEIEAGATATVGEKQVSIIIQSVEGNRILL